MTLPRKVCPKAFVHVCRRASLSQFFLTPGPETNRIFAYCFAEAATHCEMQVLAVCAMSSHYHAVLYDVHGRCSEFTERFHANLARAQNRHLGRSDHFWSGGQTTVVRLLTPEAVFGAIRYVLLNPVSAGLVERAAQWPGVNSLRMQLGGRALRVSRPRTYFAKKGSRLAAEVTLRVVQPDCFAHLSPSAWRRKVQQAIKLGERKHRKRRRGRPVVGAAAILAQSPLDRARTPRAKRGDIAPRFAGRDKWRRIEAILRDKAWLALYRLAYEQLCAGFREVVFPAGTDKLRRLGLCCAPFP